MSDNNDDSLNYDEFIPDFITDSKAHLEDIESDFLALEEQGEDADVELINKIFRAIHSIKGSAGFLSFHNIQKLSHVMETLLNKMRSGEIKPEKKFIDPLLKGVDQLSAMLDDPKESENDDIQPLYEQLNNLIVNETPSIEMKEEALEEVQEQPAETIQQEKNTEPEEDKKTANDDPDNAIDYDEFIPDFISDSKAHLEDIESDFLVLEEQGEDVDVELINKIFRAIHSIKGSAGFLSFHNIQKLSHVMETLLNKMRSSEIKPEKKFIDPLLKGVDQLNSMLDDPKESENDDIQPLYEQLNKLIGGHENTGTSKEELIEPTQEPSHESSKALVKKEIKVSVIEGEPAETRKKGPDRRQNNTEEAGDRRKSPRRGGETKQETIRVNVELLNNLITMAGELVLIRNQQLHMFDKAEPAVTSVVQHLSLITNGLQEGIMRTRMQPVGNVFSKVPRIVRDLSQSLGKDIELKISGNEVEMDKTILEALSDPLTHLIRNCCDHGIDMPEERAEAGKPEKGLICVKAYHEGGQIMIEIMDDGRGIDTNRLKEKTLEKGLKTAEQLDAMSEKELLNLIFLPGFSTAEKVTDVSGRGVGMDVVKSSIERLGGTIDMESRLGSGTTILLRLPLTLAIIPCLIVAVGEHQFAIPQVNVEELVDLYNEDVKDRTECAGDSEIYRLRKRLLPLVRLKEVLNSTQKLTKLDRIKITQESRSQIEEAWDDYLARKSTADGNGKRVKFHQSLNFAVVKVGSEKYGLIVDRILGTEEIVVKPLHPLVKGLPCYSGTTVMGNGKVVLILDIPGIADHAGVSFNHEESAETKTDHDESSISTEKQSIMLFKNGESEQFGVALPLIKRIDVFKKTLIEKVGPKEFITIDGVSTLILRLDKFLNVSPCNERDEMAILLPKYAIKPFGVMVSNVIGIETTTIELNTDSYAEDGLLGTAIIRDRMTMLLDIYKLIEKAEPGWFADSGCEYSETARKKRVLLVEDDAFFRQLVKGYLESARYDVSMAENGQAGLDIVKTDKFDLIVSDIEMPVMNGFDFIRNVRSAGLQKRLPAIALTSLDTEKDMATALQAGFDSYETKIDRQNLLKAVEKLIDT